jgi:hypothetical protein
MAADWEGLTVGEENGDGGSRKCAGEGRGGSVAGGDERRVTWPCMEESEGGKRRGEHDGVEQIFEAEAARQMRGGGPRVVAMCRAGTGKGEGALGAVWDSAATRRGTLCGRSNRGGAEGLTGGPWPQCWSAAPADRWPRAAQCARFNSVRKLKFEFK